MAKLLILTTPPDSSEAEARDELEPVSEGLLGTCSVEERRRRSLIPKMAYEQLFGILIMHLLWKFCPHPGNKQQHDSILLLQGTKSHSLGNLNFKNWDDLAMTVLTFTFQALASKAEQHFGTKIAECRSFVGMNK